MNAYIAFAYMAYMPRETYQTVRKLSRLFGNFPDCPETFPNIWKLSRLFGNFPDCLETFQTFQTVWNFSRLSGNFPDRLETFRTVWKLSRQIFYYLQFVATSISFVRRVLALCHVCRDSDFRTLAHICRESDLRTFGAHMSRKRFTRSVRKVFCA